MEDDFQPYAPTKTGSTAATLRSGLSALDLAFSAVVSFSLAGLTALAMLFFALVVCAVMQALPLQAWMDHVVVAVLALAFGLATARAATRRQGLAEVVMAALIGGLWCVIAPILAGQWGQMVLDALAKNDGVGVSKWAASVVAYLGASVSNPWWLVPSLLGLVAIIAHEYSLTQP